MFRVFFCLKKIRETETLKKILLSSQHSYFWAISWPQITLFCMQCIEQFNIRFPLWLVFLWLIFIDIILFRYLTWVVFHFRCLFYFNLAWYLPFKNSAQVYANSFSHMDSSKVKWAVFNLELMKWLMPVSAK